MSRGTVLTDRIVAAFDAGDVDAFAACFAQGAIQIHPFFPSPLQGRGAIRAAEASLFESFDEISLVRTNMVEVGDEVAVEFVVKATHAHDLPLPDGSTLSATGAVVELTMAAFFRLDDAGLIIESRRYQDNLAFMRALGIG
ncbi:MAG: nuclear transport factor 2 family protein [Ilumatobacteraceae bacterium]